MRTVMIVAGLAAFLLSACGQAGEKDEAAKAESPAAAPAGLPDGPTPGLWRVTTAMSKAPAGMTIPPVETCITEAKFEAPEGGPEGQGVECTNTTYRRDGDAMVGSAVCALPNGGKSESTMRVTGDFTRSYTMEIDQKLTIAGVPPQDSKVTMTAERLGDCPAGAAAGG